MESAIVQASGTEHEATLPVCLLNKSIDRLRADVGPAELFTDCVGTALVLDVEVTERSTRRIHHSANSRRLRRVAHVELVAEASFPRLRLIRPSDVAVVAAVHLFFGVAGCRLKKLPVRPHSVHHAVVDVERWVSRAGEEVATRVAAGRNCQLWTCELVEIWGAYLIT